MAGRATTVAGRRSRQAESFRRDPVGVSANSGTDARTCPRRREPRYAPPAGDGAIGRRDAPPAGDGAIGRRDAPPAGDGAIGRRDAPPAGDGAIGRRDAPPAGDGAIGRRDAPPAGDGAIGRRDASPCLPGRSGRASRRRTLQGWTRDRGTRRAALAQAIMRRGWPRRSADVARLPSSDPPSPGWSSWMGVGRTPRQHRADGCRPT